MKNEQLTSLIDDINKSILSLKNKEFGKKLIAYELIDKINASFNDDLTENVSKIFDLESQEHQLFKASILLYITLIEQQENIGLIASNKRDNLKINKNKNGNNSTKLTNSIQTSKTINPYQMDIEIIEFKNNKSDKNNPQIEDDKVPNNPKNYIKESQITYKTKAKYVNKEPLIELHPNFIPDLSKAFNKMNSINDFKRYFSNLKRDDQDIITRLAENFSNSLTNEKNDQNVDLKKQFVNYLQDLQNIDPNKNDKKNLLIENEKPQNNTEITQITDPTIANELSEILKVQIEILDSVAHSNAIDQIRKNNENSTDLDFFKQFDPNYVKSNNSDNINIYQNDLKTLLKNNDVLNLVKECDNQDETRILTIINNINKDNYDELSDDARSNLFKIITFDRSIGEGDSDNMNKLLGENINKAINDKSKQIVKDFNQSHSEQLNKINTSTGDIPNENTNNFSTVLGSFANFLTNPASIGVCIAIVASYFAGKNPSSDISNFKPK